MINPGTSRQKVLPSAKVSEVELVSGDIMSVQTPGSGGYGNPFKRKPELVLDDVLDGKVSAENARKQYGVAIDVERKAIDAVATEKLRGS